MQKPFANIFIWTGFISMTEQIVAEEWKYYIDETFPIFFKQHPTVIYYPHYTTALSKIITQFWARPNDRHFPYDIFKWILLKENL